MHTIRVEEEGPLLDVLARAIKNRTLAKQHVKLRRVLVNGEPADRHDHPVKAGDVLGIGEARAPKPGGRIPGLTVVYEDDSVLVVEKPAGMLTVATETEKTDTAYSRVRQYLKEKRGRVFVVHRLDRETSGLLLFAKTEDAKGMLQGAWDEVEKRYYAVVVGVPEQRTGTVESHLTESSALRVYSGPKTARSKHSVTHYRVVSSAAERSLIEVHPETGRKHQIRVHLADLGHPIVGDDRYGGPKANRLGLHASYLRFPHPETEEVMEFRSELPGAMRKAVKEKGNEVEDKNRGRRKRGEGSSSPAGPAAREREGEGRGRGRKKGPPG